MDSDMFSDHFQDTPPPQLVTSVGESDAEGFCVVSPGDLLHGRYQVISILGKGMFGRVVGAIDLESKEQVAVKILRKHMAQFGAREHLILQEISSARRDGTLYIVKMLDHFHHQGHFCLVSEMLGTNLRMWSKNRKIPLSTLKVFAFQLFKALETLEFHGIVHADIKPDNILVTKDGSMLKLCDFGTAHKLKDKNPNDRTTYLGSRYYRAPEIILGMDYGHATDVWAVGCSLFEIHTGRVLFLGQTNGEMLQRMMEYQGKFSHKMLRRAPASYLYFDESDHFSFLRSQKDPTGRILDTRVHIGLPAQTISSTLLAGSKACHGNTQFGKFVEKCLALDPRHRMTCNEALSHEFINE